MKREIKFRAWNKRDDYMLDEAIWFKSDMSEFSNWNGMIYPEYDKQIWKETILMQFTGLHDKNGVEIYEGDILEYYEADDNDFSISNKHFLITVEYNNQWAQFGWTDGGAWYDLNHYRIKGVIGNIYEHKHLLP